MEALSTDIKIKRKKQKEELKVLRLQFETQFNINNSVKIEKEKLLPSGQCHSYYNMHQT